MTLAKRLKALERGMGQGVGSDQGNDQGNEPRMTWEEFQAEEERIRAMTHDELKAFIRQEGNYPARGIAPKRGQLPNPDDYESLDIHRQIKLFFTDQDFTAGKMTYAEYQRRYSQMLEGKK